MFVPVATVQRGSHAESWSFAAAAVAVPGGRLIHRLGDPEIATFLRSAAKPLQAIPLVAAGGRGRFALDDADLALVAASHGGRPEHVERAASLLTRGGFGPEALLCGAHPPLDERAAEEMRRQGETPTPLHNNCSGNHAGLLLTCRLLGVPAEEYTSPRHPVEQRALAEVARFAGISEAEVGLATDGCGIPCYHLSLAAAARAYAALAAPDLAGLEPEVASAAGEVLAAMAAAPEMVAGPGRFTTRLARVTGGRVVGKEGAEGFYAVAIRGPVAMGVALKIADGSERCRDGVVIELLHQLGSLSSAEMVELEDLYRTPIRNHRGVEVGRIVPDFELEEIAGER